jgi:hypothetical protein
MLWNMLRSTFNNLNFKEVYFPTELEPHLLILYLDAKNQFMNEAEATLSINLSYASIPMPQKIILPIEEGKFGIFNYRQHPNDPIGIEDIIFGYENEHQIIIKMTGTGQLEVDNFANIKIGDTKIELKAGVIIENKKLKIYDVKLSQMKFSNIPSFADKLLGNLFNNVLLKHVSEKLTVDLSEFLESAKEKINNPIPINFEISNRKYNYNFIVDCQPYAPLLKITPDGIHLEMQFSFNPKILNI